MIPRYTRKEMEDIWKDKSKYEKWLRIEMAALWARAKQGMISPEIVRAIEDKAKFTVKRIEEIDKEIEHDMIAFITTVQENLNPEIAGEFHKGLTSYDIEEPAMVLQIKEAVSVIQDDIENILNVLKRQAEVHRWTVILLKTHGQAAELGTLGIKFLRWYDLLERGKLSLKQSEENISVCKLSGATGIYSTLDPQVEEEVARILRLKPARIASQILSRDRHAQVLKSLAIIASGIEQIALEIRLHSQTGVEEMQEPFKREQKGSSAMPHKRNPILCERLCGLTRVIKSYADIEMENIPTWDERDISHSGPERIIFPDTFILLDYMLSKLAYILEGLQVFPKNMQRNIDQTYGTLFSQQIKIFLLDRGVDPETTYRLVQECSFKAIKEKRFISDILQENPVFQNFGIDIQELKESCFNLRVQLKHIDEIFARFGL